MAENVAEDQRRKRSPGKMLLLVINLLLFVSGAAFFLLMKFGIINKPMASEATAPSAQTAEDKQHMAPSGEPAKDATSNAPPQEDLVAVPLRPFVVNLRGDQGRRYLRLVLQLEVKGDQAREAIDKRLAQVRDRLIFLLSSKTFDDIQSGQGKYQLQTEISQNLNDTLGAPLVAKTYFTEFIVQ